MRVLPADHLIDNQMAFAAAVESASQQVRDDWLVAFGVKPEYPETGCGYIQKDVDASLGNGFKVKRFVEKPDLDTAKGYLASGEYYWNSGMFCFGAGTLIEEMALCAPDVFSAVELCFAGSGVACAAIKVSYWYLCRACGQASLFSSCTTHPFQKGNAGRKSPLLIPAQQVRASFSGVRSGRRTVVLCPVKAPFGKLGGDGYSPMLDGSPATNFYHYQDTRSFRTAQSICMG